VDDDDDDDNDCLVVYLITYFLWYFQLLPEPSELQDGSLQALDAGVSPCDSTLDCARSHPDGRETQLSEKWLKHEVCLITVDVF
jgi:hypothetical protein